MSRLLFSSCGRGGRRGRVGHVSRARGSTRRCARAPRTRAAAPGGAPRRPARRAGDRAFAGCTASRAARAAARNAPDRRPPPPRGQGRGRHAQGRARPRTLAARRGSGRAANMAAPRSAGEGAEQRAWGLETLVQGTEGKDTRTGARADAHHRGARAGACADCAAVRSRQRTRPASRLARGACWPGAQTVPYTGGGSRRRSARARGQRARRSAGAGVRCRVP